MSLSADALLILPLTILAFLTLLSVIVFIHEFGHFSVARLLGVRVEVFSIGFGKTLARWVDKYGTEWRIAALPLGGYVKFFGDLNAASQGPADAASDGGADGKSSGPVTTQFPRPGDKDAVGMTAEERKVCFHYKPVWARAMIVAAGPMANFVLAVAIFTGLFMTLGRTNLEPVIATVQAESAAAEAGFEPGDRIVSVDGRTITKFNELYDLVLLSGGREMRFEVERDGRATTLAAAPRRADGTDRYGNPIDRWLLGVGPDPEAYSFERFGFFAALREGVGELFRVLSVTVRFLGKIVTGQEDMRQLGGPVKMAQYAGQSALSGFDESAYADPPPLTTKLKVSLIDFISLAAVVSVSIGFLNLLPIPVLDGGHLMYYGYEAIAGKPLGAGAQAVGFRVGLALLAGLMIFVTWNDINNLISSLS